MFHGNEDIMGAPSVYLGRLFSQHTLGSSVRLKKPGSCVTYAMWLKIHLLIVLLSGQAFGQLTSTAPSSIATPTTAPQTSAGETSVVPSSQAASSTFHTSTTTAAEVPDSQSSAASSITPTSATTAQTPVVFYFLDVNVDVTGPSKNESDIIAWLGQVFLNELGHCLFPIAGATTTAPTSQQTANVTEQVATTQTYKSTTAFYTLPQNYSSTVLQFNITTTAATTINGNDTTTMEAVINSNITTTAATATPQH
ncbi:mucin-5AC-like [Poecilia formosa]|uniref:mucin-5AC-like n=1 Tax=Poecilia formosa TaxID=48698 RepID=UPI0007B82C85|nr:PREDICTED: mucin-5AC-like [Poecilia formosa]